MVAQVGVHLGPHARIDSGGNYVGDGGGFRMRSGRLPG